MTYRPCSSALAKRSLASQWLAFLAILFLCGGASTGQAQSDLEAEEIALDALKKSYKLENFKKDANERVVDVRLEGKRFDNNAIDHVVKFKNLHSLGVARSSITDAGIEKLQGLKGLKRLWMGYTVITDRGLGYLEKIPTLRQIWAWELSNVTEKGFDSLRRAVPDLAINLGPEKNLPPFKNDPLYKNELINNPVFKKEQNNRETNGGLAALLLVGLVITLSLALGLWLFIRPRRSKSELVKAAAEPHQELEAQTVPGRISFQCSSCEKKLKANSTLAGKTVKCPQCNKAVLVP